MGCNRDEVTGYYQLCVGVDRKQIQVMGYSVRSRDWRYIEWFQFDTETLKADFNVTVASELYDHSSERDGGDMDASEQVNAAGDPANAVVVAEHKRMIREGWRKQLPPSSVALHFNYV